MAGGGLAIAVMLTLRPYQERALSAIRASFISGKRAPCVVQPTGSGKTILASAIAVGALSKGTDMLFVADRETLIGQTADKFRRAGVTDLRVIQADRDEGSPDARITIAMAQTLRLARWADRMPRADLIAWDECHGVVASTYDQILKRYPAAKLIGLTATPCRGDGKPLEAFDDIIVGATVKELTDLGYLARCHVMRPPPDALRSGEIALDPVQAYVRHANGQRAGVFCTTKKQAAAYQEQFLAAGIPCGVVTSDTGNRAAELARFAAGEYRALISVGCLTQGWDDPGCAVAIIARKPHHVGLWLQICGRVLRPHPDKTEALVIDLCGAFWDHGPPDLDREYSLDGKAISTVVKDRLTQCKECGSCFLVGPRQCPYCGAEIQIKAKPLPKNRNIGVSSDGTANPLPMWTNSYQAKYDGHCCKCRAWFPRGTPVYSTAGKRNSTRHQRCPQQTEARL